MLIRLRVIEDCFASLMFALTSKRFSHEVANIKYSVNNKCSHQTGCMRKLICALVVFFVVAIIKANSKFSHDN